MSRRLVMVQETSGLKSTIEAQSKSIGLEEVSNLADLMDRS